MCEVCKRSEQQSAVAVFIRCCSNYFIFVTRRRTSTEAQDLGTHDGATNEQDKKQIFSNPMPSRHEN
jgi:hypothetical protein